MPRFFQSIKSWLKGLTILQKEYLRILVSFVVALIVFIVVLLGVDESGNIGDKSQLVLRLLIRYNSYETMVFILMPFFSWVLFKAILLGVNEKFKWILDFIAGLITSVLYNVGMISVVVGIHSIRLGLEMHANLIPAGVFVTVSGFVTFFLLQGGIQNKWPPKV